MDISPFASRCRMQLLAKGLDVDFLEAPGGIKSDEYRKINPILKIPALDADGMHIPESETICEYIEDVYPEPPLRPTDLKDRAKARLISRVTDLYLLPALGPLFGQMDPEKRDQAVVEKYLEEIRTALDQLEIFIDGQDYAVGGTLSLADCALVPVFNLILPFVGRFGDDDPLKSRPKLSAYWQAIQKNPIAEQTITRMNEARANFRRGN
jgi:glutathione S-transferase